MGGGGAVMGMVALRGTPADYAEWEQAGAVGWNWDGRPAILQSRAMDETGYVQPTRAQIIATRGYNSRYHYNAIQAWRILPDGRVVNGDRPLGQGAFGPVGPVGGCGGEVLDV